MRFSILKYGVVFFLVALSIAVLMGVSQEVQRIERDIVAYDNAIEQEQEKIRVLRAEWAYLNNPMRLELLALDMLGLKSPEGNALLEQSYIPDASEGAANQVIPTPISYSVDDRVKESR